LAAYLLVLTYAKTSNANRDITIIRTLGMVVLLAQTDRMLSDFTMSLLSPVTSVMRAAFVSVNLFSLLCTGDVPVPSSAQGDIMRYGGPIVYLIGQSLFYFWILVRRESGALFRRARTRASAKERSGREDVSAEAVRVAGGEDALKVMKVSKAFEGKVVVDDVSFGVQQGTMLALLGPNGAGKTTTFNMIRA
jgi:ATP-binding cassette subfamily A (ABC1) protein 3